MDDTIEKWLEKQKRVLVQVTPSEGPDKRLDDWEDVAPKKANYVTQRNEPVTVIQTISDKMFKRLSGSMPESKGEVIRVMSPGMTTQPLLSLDIDDISKKNVPDIRVLEGGKGIPDVKMFINPWTSTNPHSMSSLTDPGRIAEEQRSSSHGTTLLEDGKADTKGHSTTKNYDEMKNRLGNYNVKIDGESMDILLPIDAADEFSGTKVSIGGVPGFLNVRSKENGYYQGKKKVGDKKNSRPLHWDGQKEG